MHLALLLCLGLGFAANGSCLYAQSVTPLLGAPGVWFLLGDASKGYTNTGVETIVTLISVFIL